MAARFESLVADAAEVLAGDENRIATIVALRHALLNIRRIETASPEQWHHADFESLAVMTRYPFDQITHFLMPVPKSDQEALILGFFFALGTAIARIDFDAQGCIDSR